MKNKLYSPSINILRDYQKDLDYISTINGSNTFNRIVQSFNRGIRSFCIIGAYGTGKSAFLLALLKVLTKKEPYFEYSNQDNTSFVFKLIIGEFNSLESQLKISFSIPEKEDFFKSFEKLLSKYYNDNKTLLILIDEFGKFLEYAASYSPEKEMYFIQKFAEVINNSDKKILLLTTLHQPFEDYALELSQSQRKEWAKVNGRIIQIPFNEPIEQILFLASEHIASKGFKINVQESDFKDLLNSIFKCEAFLLKDSLNYEFARKLYPFDLLSACVLALAFQDYGQNERSLFNFLYSDDYLGLQDFTTERPFYNLADVYDYLSFNFYTILNSKHNPHALQWRGIKDALEIIDGKYDQNKQDAQKLIKVIGLLNIFGRPAQKVDIEFLKSYSSISLQIKDPGAIINSLEHQQIIRFQNYNQKFVLFKGTDFNISVALEEANNAVSDNFNIINKLQEYFTFPALLAKKAFYEKGTPRYFVFELSEKPLEKDPEGSIDGYINLIIHDLLDEKKFKDFSKITDKAILFGWLSNSEKIREIVHEIEKINWVKIQAKDDNVVQAELDTNKKFLLEKLNYEFTLSFYGPSSNVWWFYAGERVVFKNQRELNQYLSYICNTQYPLTPIIKNESINKHKVQGTISSARKNLISRLLNYSGIEDLGFESGSYPPEKTIYYSLLKYTGIHRQTNSHWHLGLPTEQSFMELWDLGEKYLKDCCISPRKLSDFIDKLLQKPFKLKQGLIDIWIPIFLISKKSEFAFYEDNIFIPDITDDTLDVAMRQPHKYFIHTFYLNETRLKIFNQYRNFLNQIEEESPTRESFIETIKPFLTFYKRLTKYSQETKTLSQTGIRLRDAIANATNPEDVFFEDIPRALGFSTSDLLNDEILETFAIKLKEAISEISSSQEFLFNRIEDTINSELPEDNISFPRNKDLLQKRFKNIRKEELNIKQKVFYQRIITSLEDRKSWLNSVAIAVTNKSLDTFSDKEGELFKIKFPTLIHEMDNLTDLSKEMINREKEDILKLEITSFLKGVQKNLVRLPKTKSGEILKLENQIRPLLNKDKRQENIALLIKLLQEQLENEE